MIDPKSLEMFFSQYLPGMKVVIEDYWENNKEELVKFLDECIEYGVSDWMTPHFELMREWAKTAPHNYTNPWKVL